MPKRETAPIGAESTSEPIAEYIVLSETAGPAEI